MSALLPTLGAIRLNLHGEMVSGVTWYAIIGLDNGDQVRVQVRATTQCDARQLIALQYGKGRILFGPNRVDLMRAV